MPQEILRTPFAEARKGITMSRLIPRTNWALATWLRMVVESPGP